MTVLKKSSCRLPGSRSDAKIGDSWDNQNPDMSVIEEALEQGYNTERIDATLRLEAGWIDHHRHLKEGNESDNHVRGRLRSQLILIKLVMN